MAGGDRSAAWTALNVGSHAGTTVARRRSEAESSSVTMLSFAKNLGVENRSWVLSD